MSSPPFPAGSCAGSYLPGTLVSVANECSPLSLKCNVCSCSYMQILVFGCLEKYVLFCGAQLPLLSRLLCIVSVCQASYIAPNQYDI